MFSHELIQTTPQNLLLEVFDADLGKVETVFVFLLYPDVFPQDDLLGKATIDVHNIAERKQLFDQWIPLQVKYFTIIGGLVDITQ